METSTTTEILQTETPLNGQKCRGGETREFPQGDARRD